jgi:hypothetical protein
MDSRCAWSGCQAHRSHSHRVQPRGTDGLGCFDGAWAAGLQARRVVIGADFAEVLAAAQEGNDLAFSRLWRDGNPALLRYLRVMAPEFAEDVAAETWLHVVRGLARFRGDEQAWRAWLFTTARRRVIDQARRRSRRPEKPLEEALPSQLPVSPDAADLAIQHRFLCEAP